MLFCADLGILRAVTRPRGESKQDQQEQSASQHKLTGKAAIVTAGGRGTGTAITPALADAGAVVALARREREFLTLDWYESSRDLRLN